MRGRLSWWIVGVGMVVGCASAGSQPQGGSGGVSETASAQEEETGADVPSLAVHWVRDSVEYQAAAIQTYRLAGAEVERLAGVLKPGKWAVVLDADETVLDSSLYDLELERAGVTHSSARVAAWTARREAPPVPGALEFLNSVREHGGKIAIVTNRYEELCPDTEADFRRFEIPYDVILCRPAGAARDKAPRWAQIESGTASPDLPPLEIVMYVGDSAADFPDVDQELRMGPEAGLSNFGSLYFILPNPMYGSWVGNPPR